MLSHEVAPFALTQLGYETADRRLGVAMVLANALIELAEPPGTTLTVKGRERVIWNVRYW